MLYLQQVMDNLKYSLKTQQFGKKRYHIFDKDSEKESMSLQVHDPHHNVSHLIEFNRSEQISGLSQTKKSSQLHNFVEQQSKTVKFTKPSGRTQSGSSLKQKNICHSIATTQKIKIPQNPQPNRQSRTRVQEQTIRPQLQVLKHVLYNNEERLQKLVDSVNSLYRNTIELYNNHERKLKELVNQRCYQILSIFKLAIVEIKRKQDVMEQIDNRVTVLVNTLKDSKQTLRITKIKQECIEALQKEQLSILKRKLAEYDKFITKSTHQVQKQALRQKKCINLSARKHERHEMTKFESKQSFIFDISINSLENILSPKRKTTKQFEMATCSQVASDMVSSLIDSPYANLQLQQEDQKSPFQANQLYKISSTTPMTTNSNSQLNHSKQVQYSFRKMTRQSEIVEMKNDAYIMANRNARSFSYAPDNRQSLRLREVLSSIPKAMLSKEVWIDNLSCLRRKNGTYILDQNGNAIICSHQELEQVAAS